MIYSENAPELETSFHKHFKSKQVDLVNPRKEFFRLSLNDIEEYANRNGLNASFTKLAEAKEYRETLAMESAMNEKPLQEEIVAEFPDSL